MSAGGTIPSWLMLERFVFRRDKEQLFPDESKAPIRASGKTSWGADFRIAFSLAKPPRVSRLYAHLPGFPPLHVPLCVVATHRHLVLLRVATKIPGHGIWQDFFIYDARTTDNPCLLKAIPTCTEPNPIMDYFRRRPPRRRRCPLASKEEGAPAKRRMLEVKSMGLVSRGGGEEQEDEFAVAELQLFECSPSKTYAHICWLRSRTSSDSDSSGSNAAGPGHHFGGEWNSIRESIIILDKKPDDCWQLCLWQTDMVIPFMDSLCFIDYCRGILFCDVFGDFTPAVAFLRFPLKEFPSTRPFRREDRSWFYRCVTPIDTGGRSQLKFINVTRNDGVGYGALKPGAGFTITCHVIMPYILGPRRKKRSYNTQWYEVFKVTSDELWSANPELPRSILMYPQVDIDEPNVVHFLIIEFKYAFHKMWVVSIDMISKCVVSFYSYINGLADRGTEDVDLTIDKSNYTTHFLPCEFSRFLQFSRKRKNME